MRNAIAPMGFADLELDDVASRIAGATPTDKAIRATPYRWPDPRSLPTRQWLLGHWLRSTAAAGTRGGDPRQSLQQQAQRTAGD